MHRYTQPSPHPISEHFHHLQRNIYPLSITALSKPRPFNYCCPIHPWPPWKYPFSSPKLTQNYFLSYRFSLSFPYEWFSHSVMSNCGPMDCSLPGSSAHGFSRQEYWTQLPFSSPGSFEWSPALGGFLWPASFTMLSRFTHAVARVRTPFLLCPQNHMSH